MIEYYQQARTARFELIRSTVPSWWLFRAALLHNAIADTNNKEIDDPYILKYVESISSLQISEGGV
jgi:hypothetical protein